MASTLLIWVVMASLATINSPESALFECPTLYRQNVIVGPALSEGVRIPRIQGDSDLTLIIFERFQIVRSNLNFVRKFDCSAGTGCSIMPRPIGERYPAALPVYEHGLECSDHAVRGRCSSISQNKVKDDTAGHLFDLFFFRSEIRARGMFSVSQILFCRFGGALGIPSCVGGCAESEQSNYRADEQQNGLFIGEGDVRARRISSTSLLHQIIASETVFLSCLFATVAFIRGVRPGKPIQLCWIAAGAASAVMCVGALYQLLFG